MPRIMTLHMLRVSAWNSIGKHLGMFADKVEHSGRLIHQIDDILEDEPMSFMRISTKSAGVSQPDLVRKCVSRIKRRTDSQAIKAAAKTAKKKPKRGRA